ncbi:hypothetical protein BV898_05476 [Hypsibius exemplaris]|uniref:Integrase catalytic domain-containing protein n=1 Tax=Hypsibius exemplaris TaxID=2072580 RepID=A0A1W0WYZ2_HYPEX|nr:hypothetical protein BV898_05476 [Hypsibius exemplaris]
MAKFLRKIISSCVVCQTRNPIACCELTSFIIAKPVKNHTSLEFAKFLLYDVILRYGFVRTLRSDRGTEMEGVVKELLKLLEVKHLKGSGYRPQTTGKIETQHRSLGRILAKLCSENQKDWNLAVPFACFAMNAAKHAVTGVSPYQAVYGVPCLFQFDMAYPVREQLDPFIMDTADRIANIQAFIKYNIAENKRYSEALVNETRRPVTLKVGDKCLLF